MSLLSTVKETMHSQNPCPCAAGLTSLFQSPTHLMLPAVGTKQGFIHPWTRDIQAQEPIVLHLDRTTAEYRYDCLQANSPYLSSSLPSLFSFLALSPSLPLLLLYKPQTFPRLLLQLFPTLLASRLVHLQSIVKKKARRTWSNQLDHIHLLSLTPQRVPTSKNICTYVLPMGTG